MAFVGGLEVTDGVVGAFALVGWLARAIPRPPARVVRFLREGVSVLFFVGRWVAE
jgi:hypothetical protein